MFLWTDGLELGVLSTELRIWWTSGGDGMGLSTDLGIWWTNGGEAVALSTDWGVLVETLLGMVGYVLRLGDIVYVHAQKSSIVIKKRKS